jgi:hypothetical protein
MLALPAPPFAAPWPAPPTPLSPPRLLPAAPRKPAEGLDRLLFDASMDADDAPPEAPEPMIQIRPPPRAPRAPHAQPRDATPPSSPGSHSEGEAGRAWALAAAAAAAAQQMAAGGAEAAGYRTPPRVYWAEGSDEEAEAVQLEETVTLMLQTDDDDDSHAFGIAAGHDGSAPPDGFAVFTATRRAELRRGHAAEPYACDAFAACVGGDASSDDFLSRFSLADDAEDAAAAAPGAAFPHGAPRAAHGAQQRLHQGGWAPGATLTVTEERFEVESFSYMTHSTGAGHPSEAAAEADTQSQLSDSDALMLHATCSGSGLRGGAPAPPQLRAGFHVPAALLGGDEGDSGEGGSGVALGSTRCTSASAAGPEAPHSPELASGSPPPDGGGMDAWGAAGKLVQQFAASAAPLAPDSAPPAAPPPAAAAVAPEPAAAPTAARAPAARAESRGARAVRLAQAIELGAPAAAEAAAAAAYTAQLEAAVLQLLAVNAARRGASTASGGASLVHALVDGGAHVVLLPAHAG